MTKYRIREEWRTKKHVITGKVEQTYGPYFYVEHRTIWTILFGHHVGGWENLFGFSSFRTAAEAEAELDKYLFNKEIKEEVQERIILEK